MPLFKFVLVNVIEEYVPIFVEAASLEEAEQYSWAIQSEAETLSLDRRGISSEQVDDRLESEGEVTVEEMIQDTRWDEPDLVIDDEFRAENDTNLEENERVFQRMRGHVEEDGQVRFHRQALRRVGRLR